MPLHTIPFNNLHDEVDHTASILNVGLLGRHGL